MESNTAVSILHIITQYGYEASISHPVSGLNEVWAIMMVTIQITGLWNSGECAASIIRGQDRGTMFFRYIGICLPPTVSHPSDCNINTYATRATVAHLYSTAKRDPQSYVNDEGLICFVSKLPKHFSLQLQLASLWSSEPTCCRCPDDGLSNTSCCYLPYPILVARVLAH